MQIQENLAHLKEDIELRGLSANTLKSYTSYVRKFLEFTNKPVETLDEKDVRNYLIYLRWTKYLSTSTVNSYNAAMRFFFAVTLNRTMNYLQLPRFKKPKSLPAILSREEIRVLLEFCDNLKHKAMLMLAYGSGLRVAEIAALRVHDIDSQTMRVFVNNGKGGKDRYTLLSEECLHVLRAYWKAFRPKSPDGWLFLGANKSKHITPNSVAIAFKTRAKKAGIFRNVSIHSLRHSFATHLLENGVSLFHIKELLGHARISSTTIYLHLANTTAGIQSPVDLVLRHG